MRPLRLRREQTCQGPLVLIDRAHPLQEGAPPELVPVDRLHPQVLLERRAARLLAACIRSVGGGRTIVPVSGWRSRAEQQAIWDDTRAREGDAFTRQYVALPLSLIHICSWMGIRMMAWPRGVLAEPIPTAMPRPSTSIWGKRSPFSYFSSLKTCSAMGRKTSRAAVLSLIHI